MPVGVDEAGDHDVPGAVDDLGVGVDVRLDGGDLVVLDQDVAGGQVPDVRVHRQDGAAPDEDLSHGADPFLIGRTVRTVLHDSVHTLQARSVRGEAADRLDDLVDGGDDPLLERVGERQRDVLAGHSADGRVEQLEALVGDDRDDRGAPAALVAGSPRR